MHGTEQGVAAVTPQNAWQQLQVFQSAVVQFAVLEVRRVVEGGYSDIFRDLSQSHQTNGGIVFSHRYRSRAVSSFPISDLIFHSALCDVNSSERWISQS